ncbi:MAG TPA: hypothetical protein VJT72_01100 [Pseudonocardiaceae bacterium]|nr:hypothetical protein [Pseudonocardiaceae bacterium]
MTGSVSNESAWDFFVSYTQADQAWAEWISWVLEENDAVFVRRDQVLRSVLQWGRDRFAESPAALRKSERPVCGLRETAHVVLAAVRPFLSVVRTTVAVGTPQDTDVYRVGKHVLPDDPRTVSQLHSAVDAVRWIRRDRDRHPGLDRCPATSVRWRRCGPIVRPVSGPVLRRVTIAL